MKIDNVKLNGHPDFVNHVVFDINGIQYLEWINDNGCVRNHESYLVIMSDFTKQQLVEIWDYVDRQYGFDRF